MTTIDPALAEHSVLQGLTPKQLKDLEGCASLAQFKPDQFIFQQGKTALSFYLIRSGKVNIELYTQERGPRPIQTLGRGDLLGSSWFVPPFQWQADARTMTKTEVIVFDAKCVKEKCEQDPALGYALLTRVFIAISQRLDVAQKKILGLYAKPE